MSPGGLMAVAEWAFDDISLHRSQAGRRSPSAPPAGTRRLPGSRSWSPRKRWSSPRRRSSEPVAPLRDPFEEADLQAPREHGARRYSDSDLRLEGQAGVARRRSWALGGVFRRKSDPAEDVAEPLSFWRSLSDPVVFARSPSPRRSQSTSPRRGRSQEALGMHRLLGGVQEHVQELLWNQREAEDVDELLTASWGVREVLSPQEDDQLCITLDHPVAGSGLDVTVMPASPRRRRSLPPVPENGALAWCDVGRTMSHEDCALESQGILHSLAPQVLEPEAQDEDEASTSTDASHAAAEAPHGCPRAAARSSWRRGVASWTRMCTSRAAPAAATR